MTNDQLIRMLIRGSIQRAILESVGAVIVVFFFGAFLPGIPLGSLRYYGCLMVLGGAGFIAGVVWSHALSYRLLQSHAASDIAFWREAFSAQAQLLRLVPFWYCAPLGVGGLLFIAPKGTEELAPFFMVAGMFAVVLSVIVWINQRAAACLEEGTNMLTVAPAVEAAHCAVNMSDSAKEAR